MSATVIAALIVYGVIVVLAAVLVGRAIAWGAK